MLALAKNNGERIHTHRLGIQAAEMNSKMTKELKMPIYRGARHQKVLDRLA